MKGEEENKCWGGENLDIGILPTTLTKPIPTISFCTTSKKVFFAREDFLVVFIHIKMVLVFHNSLFHVNLLFPLICLNSYMNGLCVS